MPKLTAVSLTEARILRALCPKNRASSYLWDIHPVGFGIRIYPSGRKAYVLRSRVNGKQQIVTIADIDALTL
jgi:hypothetical protein